MGSTLVYVDGQRGRQGNFLANRYIDDRARALLRLPFESILRHLIGSLSVTLSSPARRGVLPIE